MLHLEFNSDSENEGIARIVTAAYIMKFDPDMDQNGILRIEIKDQGIGIPDVKKAMEPMFTTKPEEERTGMGFSFMEAFMDEVKVESEPEKGTCVRMKKIIGKGRELWTTQSL